jgi:hypothetical protein
MNDPSLAVQRALRTRFIGSSVVTNLVPADNILDHNQRPAPDPSIVLGEDQVVDTNTAVQRDLVRVYSTIHIWKRETSLEGVKLISASLRKALGRVIKLDLDDPDYFCADCSIESSRFLRDPDGETSHGIITLNSLVRQRWSVTL